MHVCIYVCIYLRVTRNTYATFAPEARVKVSEFRTYPFLLSHVVQIERHNSRPSDRRVGLCSVGMHR